ncbi:MAG: hypothetical protein ABSF63_13250 [Candidatus Bathyarchaeia archaeon]|jgi:hypothetical protein
MVINPERQLAVFPEIIYGEPNVLPTDHATGEHASGEYIPHSNVILINMLPTSKMRDLKDWLNPTTTAFHFNNIVVHELCHWAGGTHTEESRVWWEFYCIHPELSRSDLRQIARSRRLSK